MKRAITLVAGVLCGLTLQAQTPQQQPDTLRNIRIFAVNKKGKPFKDDKLLLYLQRDKKPLQIDRKGQVFFYGVGPTDTLMILYGSSVSYMPLVDIDSVKLTIQVKQRAKELEVTQNFGYGTVSSTLNTQSTTTLNAKSDINKAIYQDLADYLRGRVAGVQVTGTDGNREVIIRGGANSFLLSSAALIVIDGMACSDFEAANSMVSVNDIKSVDILKDGSIYGARGSNGVVIITTRSGVGEK